MLVKKLVTATVGVALIFALNSASGQKRNAKSSQIKTDSTKTDSLKNPDVVKLKPYKSIITAKAKTTKGLITVHAVGDKYYFEIPLTVLNKDILVINRIAEAPADMRLGNSTLGYAGDPIGSSVIHFEKGNGDKIFIRRISYTEFSRDSTKEMYAAVKKNTIQPIVFAFPITSYKPDSSAVVIDATEFINGDNEILHFGSTFDKMMYHVGALRQDRSYIHYVHTFPSNVEIHTVKTYQLSGSTRTGDYTMEVSSSLVMLPEKPMKPRYYDERVGYFTTDYIDYDQNPQRVDNASIVNRWRLEPKPEDVEKYKRGELVEPQKQIVFYIDPATPAKWVPYLIQGVNDWNKAFEKAGFKNAIVGKLAPTEKEDPSFDLDDARHSAIVYKPSPISNASGPSTADPRSGEIIESHINWYHNVMKLIHDWYMIQCAAVDPRARKMEFDDELMGQLIRFVSSHEVGHALGLRHNFGSSSTVPVDSLRNKKWVEEHGHTPSIMDYARFNYVAQPEDSISEKGLFPRIGDYDDWAIEWGYKWFGDSVKIEEETHSLNMLTIQKQKNKRLWFGSELSPTDPRSQNEDLGDNAMIAGEYGLKNLKRILPKLEEWTKTPDQNYDNLKEMYLALNSQADRYIVHVIKNIGGVMVTPKTVEQPGPVYVPVDLARQKEAMAYLDRNVFTYPVWMYDEKIFSKIGIDFVPFLTDKQRGVIESLLNPYRLTEMINQEALDGKHVYTVSALFNDLDHSIFKELYTHRPVNVYKRNYQKFYIDKLTSYLKTSLFPMPNNENGPQSRGPGYTETLDAKLSDIVSIVKYHLRLEQQLILRNIPLTNDLETKAHLMDLNERIIDALDKYKSRG